MQGRIATDVSKSFHPIARKGAIELPPRQQHPKKQRRPQQYFDNERDIGAERGAGAQCCSIHGSRSSA
jgi:hypothetical protein